MSGFLAGFAEVDYTPAPGLALRGQQYKRIAEYTHDPLMANAAAFRSGDATVVIVSNDICFLDTSFANETKKLFSQRTGLPEESLLIHATHSHVAPCTISYFWGEADPAFAVHLREAIVEAAEAAISRLKPVSVFSGSGYLEHLGWNRRVMFANGSSVMHGKSNRPDFIGIEGPRDGTLSVLFTRDEQGKIKGAIINFSNHPNSVEDGRFYSADVPGAVRRMLKSMLGEDLGVVYLTAAAGNAAPLIRYPYTEVQPWMGEEGLLRSGLYIAGEAARVIAAATEPVASPDLVHLHTDLKIPMRPFPAKDEPCYPEFWSDESRAYYEHWEAEWPRMLREESPVPVRVNVVKIGDTVICTNPTELFVEFGLKMREASPARVTIIGELFDGYAGYIPTPLAFTRGGYETWPCQTSKLVPEAGDEIVNATCQMLSGIM